MKKLNNKGYMLVEIILASAIAFGIAYFLLDLVIKLKNKNDDLLVDTLAKTDQAIITNTIMRDIYNNEDISCSDISINNNKLIYKDKTLEINKYTTINSPTCTINESNITINIPLQVKTTKKSYDVNININKKIK